MREAGTTRMALALVGIVGASAVAAQQPLDTQDLAATRVQAASCAEVAWASDMLAQYPRIAEGCQEVVTSGDRKWARFEADIVRNNPDGTVALSFKNRQGRSIEELTLMPVQGQRVLIGDRQYRFSELNSGQTVSLYVPEGMYAVATEPGAPTERLAQIVREPTSTAAQTEPATRVAQAEPASQQPVRTAQRLPSTAGPLPLVALAGILSMLGGLGLGIRRRFGSAKK